ncbi:MAG TPA: porin [Burkholderiaceae bacterium]|nr:porin [Burkholderiaceae bacterium]
MRGSSPCRGAFRAAFLAVTACSALGSGAASAEGVTVYGVFDTGVGSLTGVKAPGAASTRTVRLVDGGMITPFVGLRGEEDLGGGLRAGFVLEAFYDSRNGALGRPVPGGDTLFNREASVDVSGEFGTIKLGHVDAPALMPTILLNPLGGAPTLSPLFTHIFVTGLGGAGALGETAGLLGGNTLTDSGWNDAIVYGLPKVAGLDAKIYYQLGGVAGQSGKGNVGVNFLYRHGPLTLGGYYQHDWICNPIGCLTLNVTTGATSTPTALLAGAERTWFIGGSYDFSVAKLFAGYNSYALGAQPAPAAANGFTVQLGNFGDRIKTPEAGVSVPIGSAKLSLAWASTRNGTIGKTWGTTSLVYDYSLSKRTDAYAGAMRETYTGYASGSGIVAGLRHSF